ncbi:MAG: hypothetical protein KH386_13425 [Bacteroides sp.]|nr:hypothetical protein [Bacteroides sp.]
MNRVFIIGGRSYNMASPTTQKLSLAGKHLKNEIEKSSSKSTYEEIFNGMPKKTLCKALSCLISGDLSLVDELSIGEKNELVEALNLIYTGLEKDFVKLFKIADSICRLAAKPKE